jgi:O-antigen/teichoic acid export membrane protein
LHLSRARDVLLLVAAILLAIDLLITASGWWPLLLGSLGAKPGIPASAAYTFACIALSIPLGIGSRLLQGMGRMKTAVKISLLAPVIQVVMAVGLLVLHAPAAAFGYAPATGYLAIAVVGFAAGTKAASTHLAPLFAGLRAWKSDTIRLAETAIPFLLVSVGMAAGFQSQRILLSNWGTTADVAQYSLVAQFAGPLIAILSVIGQNLWTRYRAQFARGELDRNAFLSHVAIFGIIGLSFAVALCVFVPLLAPLISGGVVVPSIWVAVAGGLYIVVVAVHQPSAMMLNDTRGLWAQAVFVAFVAIGAITTTIFGAPYLGAVAPYAGIAVSMLLLQVIPSFVLAFRKATRGSPQVVGTEVPHA